MANIKWGIIGCGDVTEVKSGPAFNKINNSSLVAVMRRDADKAKDYAQRHGVPKWYAHADEMLNDPEVNAIYVATPPLYHEEYTLAALKLGKPVYVEKPMALSEVSARKMQQAAEQYNTKLTVAHYRRGLPLFKTIKELIRNKTIGDVKIATLNFLQPDQSDKIAKTDTNWRTDPAISGGGLFHDMAPHQIDLMAYFFGNIKRSVGVSANQAGLYNADDIVSGEVLFENNILFKGLWCFTVPQDQSIDRCDIIGSEGKISFSVFGNYYTLTKNGTEERFEFALPQHIQQPMLEEVVSYFLGNGPNPCMAAEAAEIMRVMDSFTK